MDVKKNKNADLESRRPTFFLVGLILTMAVVLQSFEWASFKGLDASLTAGLDEELPPEVVIPISFEQPKIEDHQEQPKESDEFEITTEPIVEPVEPKPIPTPQPILPIDPIGDPGPITFIEDPIDDEPVIEPVLPVAEVMPEFEGGMKKMYEFIGNNIVYPEISKDNNSQGRVYVTFTVEKNGEITNLRVVKSTADKYCDKEAVRVISKMPKWKPGRQSGRRVRVDYTLPIKFSLK